MAEVRIGRGDALVVVDAQVDFCAGGALPVPGGEAVVPVLNEYIEKFSSAGLPVYLTRDWHPPNHSSFRSEGGRWPPHCVRETPGAAFHNDLHVPPGAEVVSKADRRDEAYSVFKGTDMEKRLRESGTRRLFVGGLATDYCVRETVLDGLAAGFSVFLLADACRGIGAKPGGVADAEHEMLKSGATRITVSDLRQPD